MKVSEFIRQIKKQGIMFKKHGSRHDVYYNPKTGQETQVPRHQSKELATGTRNAILEDLGLK
jgi:predicted RNA binding protein YcfA (HicA-like mRNA interferase family)